MPAPLDLAGRSFGKLIVLVRGERVRFGRWQQGWVCRCECGAELTVPQDRLPHRPDIAASRRRVDACPDCRGLPCAVCGRPVPMRARLQNPTCSPECEDRRRKRTQLKHWRKRYAADPDLPRKMYTRRKEKVATDPEYADRVRRWEGQRQANHKARMRSDSEYAERVRSMNRGVYAKYRDRIQARRKERLDAMTPDELAAWLDRAKEYTRNYARRQHAEIVANPERHQQYLDIQAEYRRRRREAKAVAELARIQTQLETRRGHESLDQT